MYLKTANTSVERMHLIRLALQHKAYGTAAHYLAQLAMTSWYDVARVVSQVSDEDLAHLSVSYMSLVHQSGMLTTPNIIYTQWQIAKLHWQDIKDDEVI